MWLNESETIVLSSIHAPSPFHLGYEWELLGLDLVEANALLGGPVDGISDILALHVVVDVLHDLLDILGGVVARLCLGEDVLDVESSCGLVGGGALVKRDGVGGSDEGN